MKVEPDGSFKRAPSNFRNRIAKGGDFEPELGESNIAPIPFEPLLT